jgi:hypothetical protein
MTYADSWERISAATSASTTAGKSPMSMTAEMHPALRRRACRIPGKRPHVPVMYAHATR